MSHNAKIFVGLVLPVGATATAMQNLNMPYVEHIQNNVSGPMYHKQFVTKEVLPENVKNSPNPGTVNLDGHRKMNHMKNLRKTRQKCKSKQSSFLGIREFNNPVFKEEQQRIQKNIAWEKSLASFNSMEKKLDCPLDFANLSTNVPTPNVPTPRPEGKPKKVKQKKQKKKVIHSTQEDTVQCTPDAPSIINWMEEAWEAYLDEIFYLYGGESSLLEKDQGSKILYSSLRTKMKKKEDSLYDTFIKSKTITEKFYVENLRQELEKLIKKEPKTQNHVRLLAQKNCADYTKEYNKWNKWKKSLKPKKKAKKVKRSFRLKKGKKSRKN